LKNERNVHKALYSGKGGGTKRETDAADWSGKRCITWCKGLEERGTGREEGKTPRKIFNMRGGCQAGLGDRAENEGTSGNNERVETTS